MSGIPGYSDRWWSLPDVESHIRYDERYKKLYLKFWDVQEKYKLTSLLLFRTDDEEKVPVLQAKKKKLFEQAYKIKDQVEKITEKINSEFKDERKKAEKSVAEDKRIARLIDAEIEKMSRGDKIRNPESGRLVLKTGPTGKKVIESISKYIREKELG